MDQNDFERTAKELVDHCWQTLVVKGADHTKNGDRLHNFKAAARRRGIHPIEALTGMKLKHEVSIEDIRRDVVGGAGVPTADKLLEKIGDDINYNILLYALLVEIGAEAGKEKRCIPVWAGSNPGPIDEYYREGLMAVPSLVAGECDGCCLENKGCCLPCIYGERADNKDVIWVKQDDRQS